MVAVDRTITDAGTMRTFASVVRLIEIAQVQATSQEINAGLTLRFGSAEVTLPSPVADRTNTNQPSQSELAFVEAVTSHLAP